MACKTVEVLASPSECMHLGFDQICQSNALGHLCLLLVEVYQQISSCPLLERIHSILLIEVKQWNTKLRRKVSVCSDLTKKSITDRRLTSISWSRMIIQRWCTQSCIPGSSWNVCVICTIATLRWPTRGVSDIFILMQTYFQAVINTKHLK